MFIFWLLGSQRWCRWAICLEQQRVFEEALHRKGECCWNISSVWCFFLGLSTYAWYVELSFGFTGSDFQGRLRCSIHWPRIRLCVPWWKKCCIAGCFWRLGKGGSFFFWQVTLIWFFACFCTGSYWICYVQVREQGQQKGEASPFLAELLRLEEQAKQQGLGRWTKVSSPCPRMINFNFRCMVPYTQYSSTEHFLLP